MKKGRIVTEAKISNLDELTKVLSVKKEAQEQLLVVMQSFGIDKIVQNLKFKKIQGFTLGSLSVTLVIVHLWGKTVASATSNHLQRLCNVSNRTLLNERFNWPR